MVDKPPVNQACLGGEGYFRYPVLLSDGAVPMAKDPRTKQIDFFNSKASKKYTEISRKFIREVQSGYKNLEKTEELGLEWKSLIAENSKVFPPGYQRFSRKTHKKITRAIELLEGAYLDLAMIREEEGKYRK